MLTELIAFLGAVGIAITAFFVIVALSDRPLKALITAIMLTYSLFFIYIYILNKIAIRKEEKPQEEQRYSWRFLISCLKPFALPFAFVKGQGGEKFLNPFFLSNHGNKNPNPNRHG